MFVIDALWIGVVVIRYAGSRRANFHLQLRGARICCGCIACTIGLEVQLRSLGIMIEQLSNARPACSESQ